MKSPLLSRDSGSTRSAPPSPRRKKTLVGLSYSVIPEVISCPGPSGLCPLIDSHQVALYFTYIIEFMKEKKKKIIYFIFIRCLRKC